MDWRKTTEPIYFNFFLNVRNEIFLCLNDRKFFFAEMNFLVKFLATKKFIFSIKRSRMHKKKKTILKTIVQAQGIRLN